ncbi:MAG TPA: EAL domain-containing protein [Frankiaceae bacterium]|jgi:diguanylate cyclase (GGDEF)-like protein/PAS domain S-box-containing protein|nr:EAL domain-containing protein [Frankiaceae bacterium]
MTTTSWRRFLAAGLAGVVLVAVAPADQQPTLTLVLSAIALVAMRRGTRAWAGNASRPWTLLMAGAWMFIAAQLVRAGHAAVIGQPKPFPSPADPVFYLGYGLMIAGIVFLVRRRRAQVEGDNLLDALIIVTSLGVLVSAYVLQPYVTTPYLDVLQKTLSIAYTVCDLVLVGVTVRLAVGGGRRNMSYYLLGIAWGMAIAADALVTVETMGVALAPWTYLTSALAYVFLASSAMHPSMATLSEKPPAQEVRLTRRRLVLLFGAMVLVPGMLALEVVNGTTPRTPVYAGGSVVMALLVLGRLAGLVRSKERKAARETVLRAAAASFAGSTDAGDMLRAAVDALASLADAGDDTRVSLATIDEEGTLRVVASVGFDAGITVGAVAVPGPVTDAIRRGEAFTTVLDPPPYASDRNGKRHVLAVPLVARQSVRGGFVVTSKRRAVAFEVARAVGALADQLSVALEANALADEIARRRHERRFRALVENGSDLVILVDGDGTVFFASPACRHLLGIDDTDMLGRHPLERIHPEDRFLAGSLLDVVWASAGAREPIEARFLHADGSWRWFEMIAENLLDDEEVGGVVVHFRDITDRRRAQRDLQESAARFRSLVQHASDVVVVLDQQACISYVSPSVTRVLGYLPDELVGTSGAVLLHDEDVAMLPVDWHESFPPFTREARVRRRNGDWAVVEFTASDLRREPGVEGIVLNGRDVTDRKTLEAELRRLALHDGLTGLPNRTLFLDRVTQALAREPAVTSIGVLFVDLDDFKTVNDGLGHVAGDALLKAVAGRIAGCLRAQDTAARLGGDEFGVLLDDISAFDAVEVAHRIGAAFGEPFVVDGRQLHVTATVGVVVRHDERVSTEVLLRRADVAMYLAKTRGKNRVQVYEPGMEELFRERLELKGDLAAAVADEQFRLVYQPIVSLEDGGLEGFEALVRWQHPERGLVPPNVFVPIAEETGDIVALGLWVLRTACEQLASWQREYGIRPRMSVNLSIRQLEHPALLAQVREAIADAGINAADLTLEITESVLAADVDVVRSQLAALKGLGVKVAIDDFGTGYSSFGYLNQFPIDVLKIDRAFVMDLDAAESEQADIVRAIVALARSRGLRTVAEGIEETTQADVLRELGCDTGQGYLYSRPQSPGDLAETLRAAATVRAVLPSPRRPAESREAVA